MLYEVITVRAVRFYDEDGHLIADSDASNTLTYGTVTDPVGAELLGSESIILDWRDGYLFAVV